MSEARQRLQILVLPSPHTTDRDIVLLGDDEFESGHDEALDAALRRAPGRTGLQSIKH